MPIELGAGEYSGELPTQEIQIAGPLSAAVQMKKTSGRPAGGMPGDAAQKTFWLVLIPNFNPGIVETRDIITDDLGDRYQTLSNYVTPLSANFLCEKLDI